MLAEAYVSSMLTYRQHGPMVALDKAAGRRDQRPRPGTGGLAPMQDEHTATGVSPIPWSAEGQAVS
jgi:hypothetical protein